MNNDYKDGSVRVQEIVNELVFGFKGDFHKKLQIFFEVNSENYDNGVFLSKVFLKNYLTSLLHFYEEIYLSSQEIAS